MVRGGLEILPGPQSLHSSDAAILRFDKGKVSAIQATGREGDAKQEYDLEPVMVTGLFEGSDRTKQQLIKFDDFPRTWSTRLSPLRTADSFSTTG